MYDYIIIHGSFGTPFENWFPWLFGHLNQQGKKVLAPQFPTIEQNIENWDAILQAYDKYIGENTSIIAHSLGPAFTIDYLLCHKKKINNLFFVAPFYGLINIEEFDCVNKSFFLPCNFAEAKNCFNKAWCFFSDNDPYVPRKMSKDFTAAIDAKEILIEGGGHLNASAGYTTFNELLKVIEDNE